ncbi:MAG: ribonuclease Z [Clostridia bacterium]|nr:ribonuclease Z [Clostridia bacterium]
MFDICLLGTSGMMPLPKRFLTSALFRYNGNMVLIDCGEATQITLKMLGWGFKNINTICFTHFHADHISGLPGMLLTLSNSGREEPLTIIGPKGVKKVCESLRVIAPDLTFDINYIEADDECNEFHVDDFVINTLEVKHGINCLAYSISIPRKGKFNLEKAEELNIPKTYWHVLQNGEEIDGFKPEMVMGEARKGFKVSYCTDTRPTENLPAFVSESDLFICEGMYGDDEEQQKAIERKHMMFKEAASIAKEGNVNELWLTHFSPSLTNPQDYIDDVKNIFTNAYVGKDRMIKTLKYEED